VAELPTVANAGSRQIAVAPPVRVLGDYGTWIECVAISADGNRVISGAIDDRLRLCDLQTDEPATELEGHTDPVQAVAITSDGRRAVSGSSDGTVRVWDLEAGKCEAEFGDHEGAVWDVAVTPDGSRAISGADDRSVRIWDLKRLRGVLKLEGHTSTICGVAMTPDGRQAVSAAADNSIRVWDLERGVCTAKLLGHNGFVGCVEFTPDGRWVLSGSEDMTARLWDLETGECAAEFEGHTDTVNALAITPDGHRAVTASLDKTLRVWNLSTRQHVAVLEGHTEWVFDVAMTPDGHRAVSGSMDETMRVWDLSGLEDTDGPPDEAGSRSNVGEDTSGASPAETLSSNGTPWISSPPTFKWLKEAILALKSEGHVLMTVGELKQRIEARLSASDFTLQDLQTAVRLLVAPGDVWDEFGDYVVLQPASVNAYAAAVLQKIGEREDGIGSIAEKDVLTGKLRYQNIQRLPREQEQIVLGAVHHQFVERAFCFPEQTAKGTQLIFPFGYQAERPEPPSLPTVSATYRFDGPPDEIYATLVVRLLHTGNVCRKTLWQDAADLRTPSGRRLGLTMTRTGDAAGEITVYCELQCPSDTKATFFRYVHQHLAKDASEVERLRVCPHCREPVGLQEMPPDRTAGACSVCVCTWCENRIKPAEVIEEQAAPEASMRSIRKWEERARRSINNEYSRLNHAARVMAVVAEAGQIFRRVFDAERGVDAEIEFCNDDGAASGKRVYLQLDEWFSCTTEWDEDVDIEYDVFPVRMPRRDYWERQTEPILLVVDMPFDMIDWMDISLDLSKYSQADNGPVAEVVFDGTPFTPQAIRRLRDKLLPPP